MSESSDINKSVLATLTGGGEELYGKYTTKLYDSGKKEFCPSYDLFSGSSILSRRLFNRNWKCLMVRGHHCFTDLRDLFIFGIPRCWESFYDIFILKILFTSFCI